MGPPRQRDFRYFLKTQVGDLSDDSNIDKLVRLCFSRQPVPGLDGAMWRFKETEAVTDDHFQSGVTRRIKQSDRSLGAIATIVIEELTRLRGCERACVKFPVDVRYIPELMQWSPQGKVVHITRDPRGLAMSKSNDPSGTARMVNRHPSLSWLIRKAALLHVVGQYRQAARLHQSFEQLGNYRLFRYEDLLAAPEQTIRELCEFVDTDFREEMLEPQKGQHEHQPSSLTGKRQKAFDPAAATRWQTVISRPDYWLISCLTRGSMKKLGYNPEVHPIFQGGQLGHHVRESHLQLISIAD